MGAEKRSKHVVSWPNFDVGNWWHQMVGRSLLPSDPEHVGWLRVEEFHEGDDLVVRAEIPGVDPDKDIEVTLTDGVVRIEAHRQEKTEHKEKDGYRSEIRYGSFSREFSVPRSVTMDDVKASYTDGILEVRVPCPVDAEPPSAGKVPISRT